MTKTTYLQKAKNLPPLPLAFLSVKGFSSEVPFTVKISVLGSSVGNTDFFRENLV